MFKPLTLRYLAVLVAAYLLLLLPGVFFPRYFESPAAYLALAPYLSLALFHKLGMPGLLEHNGLCGWGWCSPTPFGWVFVVIVWLAAAWCIAWLLSTIREKFRRG